MQPTGSPATAYSPRRQERGFQGTRHVIPEGQARQRVEPCVEKVPSMQSRGGRKVVGQT